MGWLICRRTACGSALTYARLPACCCCRNCSSISPWYTAGCSLEEARREVRARPLPPSTLYNKELRARLLPSTAG